DLRGNAFHCDCKLKWLVEWLSHTSALVEPIECHSPAELNRTSLSELRPGGFNCITTARKDCQPYHESKAGSWLRQQVLLSWKSQPNGLPTEPPGLRDSTPDRMLISTFLPTELVLFDTLPEQSLSIETFIYHDEENLVIAQPFTGRCNFLEWDHVTGKFRSYATI
ncbi:hypothetical protein L345_17718, partial [Ophiophagus hannah]